MSKQTARVTTIITKTICDFPHCTNSFRVLGNNLDTNPEELPEGWKWDCIDDFHFCPSCSEKLIKAGRLIPDSPKSGCYKAILE